MNPQPVPGICKLLILRPVTRVKTGKKAGARHNLGTVGNWNSSLACIRQEPSHTFILVMRAEHAALLRSDHELRATVILAERKPAVKLRPEGRHYIGHAASGCSVNRGRLRRSLLGVSTAFAAHSISAGAVAGPHGCPVHLPGSKSTRFLSSTVPGSAPIHSAAISTCR